MEIILSGLAVLALLAASPARADEPVRWQAAVPGIEHGQLLAAGRTVHAFRIDLEKARLRLIAAGAAGERRPVAAMAAAFPQSVAVNASFFDERGRAMGAAVDAGVIVSQRVIKPWGALVVEKRRARIVLGSELRFEQPLELVVQGIPRLLVKGEPVKLKPQTAVRTAVCAEGQHVILVITGSLEASALALLLRDRLGCHDALNLDGGPSTQLRARLGKLSLDVEGGWGVPNALIAVPGR